MAKRAWGEAAAHKARGWLPEEIDEDLRAAPDYMCPHIDSVVKRAKTEVPSNRRYTSVPDDDEDAEYIAERAAWIAQERDDAREAAVSLASERDEAHEMLEHCRRALEDLRGVAEMLVQLVVERGQAAQAASDAIVSELARLRGDG